MTDREVMEAVAAELREIADCIDATDETAYGKNGCTVDSTKALLRKALHAKVCRLVAKRFSEPPPTTEHTDEST